MLLQKKNFSAGILANTLTDVATSFIVASNSLPTSELPFRVIVWNQPSYPTPGADPDVEIITATYSSLNTYDLIRGEEGTTAKSHPAGSFVVAGYTAGILDEDIKILGTVEVDETSIGVDKILVVKDVGGVYKFQYEDKTSGGVTAHSDLTGKDYDSAGHTGFQPTIPAESITAWDGAVTDSHDEATVGGNPLTISGQQISFNYDETNLKLTSNKLDTIQGIASGASPSFTGLTLSGMNSAGFVKNSDAGLLSGGNTIAATDVSVTDTADYFNGTNAETVLAEVGNLFKNGLSEPTGFENITDSDFTFDDASPVARTLTISPKAPATSFNYYIKGKVYNIAEAKTIQIADTTGVHFVYFDTDKALHELVNPTNAQITPIIQTKALVSCIYWNATAGTAIYLGEERHGCVMDGITHEYLHFSEGLKYYNGLGLNTFSADGNGSSDSHAQFGVDLGNIADEDIHFTTSAILSTTGLPIYYMLGSSGSPVWNKTVNAGFSVRTLDNTSATRLAYNQLTGGSWQLTAITSNDYVLYHVFATTEKTTPLIAIMGQNLYATKPLAEAGAQTEIQTLVLNDILFPEIRPIASVLFQTNTGFANAVNAIVVTVSSGLNYVDFRNTAVSRVALTTSNHNSLTGIQGGTTGEYYHLTSAENGGNFGVKNITTTGVATFTNVVGYTRFTYFV